MNIINAIKTGSVINISINGKLEKKVCSNSDDANAIYKMVLTTKENPTDQNIQKLYAFLNDTSRIATIAGFEVDVKDGKTYLEGFNTPVPQAIMDMIQDYYENEYPYQSILNFWKLLMANPDVRVRETLFYFLTKFNFVLTENGYFVTYKAVKNYLEPPKAISDTDLISFVKEKFNVVKNKWKQSPKNFTIYQKDGKYIVAETKTFKGDATTIGLLNELYEDISNKAVEPKKEDPTYTDKHTGTMRIKLGIPVQQERKTCNGDPSVECDSGLHCGHIQYVQHFANESDTILSCLVNPAHVVAVPKYDNTKLRTSEYFPLSIVDNFHTLEVSKQQSFFESDYIAYEKEELEKMIELVKKNQLPIESAKKTTAESRNMDELLKIIETRLLDIQ